jgi:uncharacterized protein YggE
MGTFPFDLSTAHSHESRHPDILNAITIKPGCPLSRAGAKRGFPLKLTRDHDCANFRAGCGHIPKGKAMSRFWERHMRKTAFVISLLATMLSYGDASAQSPPPTQPPGRSVLTVEGNGRAQAKPDYARLTAELLAKAPTMEGAVEASKTLVPRVDTLLQSLKNEGVEIESSHFSLGETPLPHPAPNGSQAPPPSYTATTSYSLKLAKIDQLNAVVSQLASSGLLEMRQASFHVADEHVPMDAARRDAVADAKRQAEVLADAAGVRLDDLASISDARSAPLGQMAYDLPAATTTARKYLQIIPPANLDLSASVVMSWHISPKP